jgi:hypothetical protein
MKNLFISLIVFIFAFTNANATTYISAGSGDWGNSSTWIPAGVPQHTDSVVIKNTHVVTVTDTTGLSTTSAMEMGAPYWLRWNIVRFYHSGGMYIENGGKLVIDYLYDPNCHTQMDESTGFINNGNLVIDGDFEMIRHPKCGFTITNHNNDFINLGYAELGSTGALIVGDDMILVEGSSTIHNANTGSTGDDFYLVGSPYVCGVGFLQIEDVIYEYDTLIYTTNVNTNNSDPLYRHTWTFDQLIESNKICPTLTLGDPANNLPVTLIRFDAKYIDQFVRVSWTTANEINNDYFSVERSDDGVDFYQIGVVAGNGNSEITLDYEFVDNTPISGVSYYRITQVDYDGQFETFKPVAVKSTFDNIFKVYPNPCVGQLNVVSEGGRLQIINNIGQVLMDRSVTVETITLDYPAGIYIVS